MRGLLLTSAVAASAAAVVVHEPELCCGWQASVSQETSAAPVSLIVALRSSGMAQLKSVARAVSDPSSSQYGQYLSQSQIDAMTAPAAADVEAVTEWIESSGCESAEVSGHVYEVTCDADKASAWLSTSFSTVENPETQQRAMRAATYALPSSVASVATVYGLHGLPLPPRPAAAAAPEAPVAVTPQVLTDTYKVSGVKVSRSATNRQAVAEFQGQTMSSADLSTFFTQFVPNAQAGDDKVTKFVGDPGEGTPQTESSLDIQFMMGVSPGIQTEFWFYNGADFCLDLKNWTSAMLADDDIPLVHSVSYGWQGNLTQIGCTDEHADAVDADFAKLAAKGITIIFASGDTGSAYSEGDERLFPSWPASSPWVTSVGATRFVGHVVGSAEMATDQFGSGGGVSFQFDRSDAAWQEDAVAAYFASPPADPTFPPAGTFAPNGRGTPDICALGEGYQVVQQGAVSAVGGTSASTPAFAGMVSLLNEARIQAGQPPLGFLNPFLYKNADAFADVTLGTNAIGRGTYALKYGYNATKGWDPATGLGSPLFDKLLAAATAAAANATRAD